MEHGEQVVDVADLGQRFVDQRHRMGGHLLDAGTGEPFGQVVLVDTAVDGETAAHRRVAELRGWGIGVPLRQAQHQRAADPPLGDGAPDRDPGRREAAPVADLEDPVRPFGLDRQGPPLSRVERDGLLAQHVESVTEGFADERGVGGRRGGDQAGLHPGMGGGRAERVVRRDVS